MLNFKDIPDGTPFKVVNCSKSIRVGQVAVVNKSFSGLTFVPAGLYDPHNVPSPTEHGWADWDSVLNSYDYRPRKTGYYLQLAPFRTAKRKII